MIGAIIDLGNCLDLADASSLQIIRAGYDEFQRANALAGAKLPVNESAQSDDIDLVRRHLDCAVVNFVHLLRERESLDPFDTVRGVFTEGGELYPGAKIMAKTHVQVCVRDPKKSIKGYFRPLKSSGLIPCSLHMRVSAFAICAWMLISVRGSSQARLCG